MARRTRPVVVQPKVKKVKKVWYKCTKTLKTKTGEICFNKKQKYLFIRKVESKVKDLRGILLVSEVSLEHMVNNTRWGVHFVKVPKKKKKEKVVRRRRTK